LDPRTNLLTQLDDVLGEWRTLESRCGREDFGDLGDIEGMRFVTRARAVVRRVGGQRSAYVDQAEAIIAHGGFVGFVASRIVGVVDSLRADVAAGYLRDFATLIRGELFADFLEMAGHLLDEGYKDAAAVVAGSSLEAHLRQLCAKWNIDTESKSGEDPRPKKADLLNSELAKVEAYSKLDQKSITGWLDLRNRAAHGQYAEYEAGQVAIMISGVRDLVTRVPA
jgi:hypothetical protein